MTRPRACTTGTLQSLASDPATLAEGVKSKSIGNRNFEVIVGDALVRDIVTVSEDELKDALRVAWTRLKLAIEPTAALTLAAYLTGRVPAGSAEHPTVIVLSGGNFDPATVAAPAGVVGARRRAPGQRCSASAIPRSRLQDGRC